MSSDQNLVEGFPIGTKCIMFFFLSFSFQCVVCNVICIATMFLAFTASRFRKNEENNLFLPISVCFVDFRFDFHDNGIADRLHRFGFAVLGLANFKLRPKLHRLNFANFVVVIVANIVGRMGLHFEQNFECTNSRFLLLRIAPELETPRVRLVDDRTHRVVPRRVVSSHAEFDVDDAHRF